MFGGIQVFDHLIDEEVHGVGLEMVQSFLGVIWMCPLAFGPAVYCIPFRLLRDC